MEHSSHRLLSAHAGTHQCWSLFFCGNFHTVAVLFTWFLKINLFVRCFELFEIISTDTFPTVWAKHSCTLQNDIIWCYLTKTSDIFCVSVHCVIVPCFIHSSCSIRTSRERRSASSKRWKCSWSRITCDSASPNNSTKRSCAVLSLAYVLISVSI